MAAKECKWWSRPFLERSSSERATGRSRSSTGSTSKSGRARGAVFMGLTREENLKLGRGDISGGSGRC